MTEMEVEDALNKSLVQRTDSIKLLDQFATEINQYKGPSHNALVAAYTVMKNLTNMMVILKKELNQLKKDVAESHDRVNDLTVKKIEEQASAVSGIADAMLEIEGRVSALEKTPAPTFAELIKKGLQSEDKDVVKNTLRFEAISEYSEAKKIEKNLIISGLPEGKKEEEMLDAFLNTMEVDKQQVKKKARLRKKNSDKITMRENQKESSPLLLIELDSASTRDRILSQSSRLKNIEGFRRIYIFRDQTKTERAKGAALRKQRDLQNEQLTEVDEHGRKFGRRSDGTTFFYAVRGDSIVEITRRK